MRRPLYELLQFGATRDAINTYWCMSSTTMTLRISYAITRDQRPAPRLTPGSSHSIFLQKGAMWSHDLTVPRKNGPKHLPDNQVDRCQ